MKTSNLVTKSSIALIIALIAILLLTVLLFSKPKAKSTSGEFPFVAGRIFGPEDNDMIINFTKLREVMNDRYEDRKLPVGIYFEYLPTGASVAVNGQLEVEIGSLSKVPAVIAMYGEIEKGNVSANEILTVSKSDVDSYFGDLWKKGEGAQLTVGEAIDLALKRSDNTAANVLVSRLPEGALTGVFDELDLPKTRTGPFPTMSPKSFASVFRTLYLSAYLDPGNSNAILEDLSQTDFKDKLPAGVDVAVPVSHKIGVFQANGETIYNDCGIVYIPERPYILCIVSKTDEATAREEIAAYSRMVYSFVSQVKSND